MTFIFHTQLLGHLLKVFVIIHVFSSLVNIYSSVDLVEKWRSGRIKLGLVKEVLSDYSIFEDLLVNGVGFRRFALHNTLSEVSKDA